MHISQGLSRKVPGGFFKNVALLRDPRQLLVEAGQFRGWFRLPTGPRKGPTMSGDVLLPFVEAITGNAEFPSDLGGRALAGVEQLDRLSFKLGREPSSFGHITPPWERIVPPFEVSVKPGLAHSPFPDVPDRIASIFSMGVG
jgi:hypothetical protein